MATIDKKVNTRFTAKDGITKRFGLMDRAAARFGRTSDRSFRKANRGASRFRDITKGILAANLIERGFRAATRGLASFITEASKIEDAVAGFTPILRSVTRAEELVEKLNQTAATTPFQFAGIANIAKQLLPVMNDSIEDTVKTFRMLGDTAGGDINKLESITRGYTKALLKGKPDMESLNMIAEAGVPIFTEMAKSMGITVDQLFQLSKKGKLTSNDLTNTFKIMTSEGGLFFGGMEIASKTMSGIWSTLKDNISLAAAAIGTAILPQLKEFTLGLIDVAKQVRAWAEANQGMIKQGFEQFVNNVKTALPTIIDSMRVLADIATVIWSAFKATGEIIAFIAFNAAKLQDLEIAGGGGFDFEAADPGQVVTEAPNAAEAQARAQQSTFRGRLDIAGAPEGSTLTTGGTFPTNSGFDVALLGINP
jgi:tape measure domain-containing protein